MSLFSFLIYLIYFINVLIVLNVIFIIVFDYGLRQRIEMFYFYRFLLVIIGITSVFSANWAEISGSVDQNVVIPASSVFMPRSGSASVVIPRTPRPPGDRSDSDEYYDRVFILGIFLILSVSRWRYI